MRVTNSMISNSARQHISIAKNKVMTAEAQYTTEKKIQRPSDDPTIASRSLKFRSTVEHLKQYVEKNVKDAMDWMDTTEGALTNASSILTDMKGVMNEGAHGTLAAQQRVSVLKQLREYANSIFEEEANSNYAGRYLFTGYRTDTSLLFPTASESLEYQITQKFESSDISLIRNVTSNIAYQEGATAEEYAEMETKINECYRIQLAYNNCSKDPITGGTDAFSMGLVTKDADGDLQTTPVEPIGIVSKDDPYVYDLEQYNQENGTSYTALYVYDAGDVVLSEDLYGQIQAEDASITIDYAKKSFEKNSIRPEMYFQCTSYNTVSLKTIQYNDPDGQDIDYEVNTRQYITVNTQAKDAYSTDIYRVLDYIEQTIEGVNDVEERIAEVEKRIANTPEDDEETLEALKTLKESLENEEELRVSVMNSAFGKGLTMVDTTSQVLDVAVAELGAVYNRLQLTYDKLLDQQTIADEQLSNNEDIEISDAIINLTQADNLYQASLSATAKILGNSLLNYI